MAGCSDKVAPIAIIGMNLKFPGDAVSPQAFWDLIMSARNVATEIPADRFNIDGEDSPRVASAKLTDEHGLICVHSVLSP